MIDDEIIVDNFVNYILTTFFQTEESKKVNFYDAIGLIYEGNQGVKKIDCQNIKDIIQSGKLNDFLLEDHIEYSDSLSAIRREQHQIYVFELNNIISNNQEHLLKKKNLQKKEKFLNNYDQFSPFLYAFYIIIFTILI
eukprot:GHVR01002586.1.p2 GENE.GHVR01002586.1~~GHVR01002586.1.p2  ORF type:complete len:138 (+),score=21.30 GHVR01002586.1:769-1182(+)